ncbi:MAG: hypothetical protein GY820_20785 [Gammaproteobacteria bacterium]|nr:hypothetical protein [Gammaproteobacteria bacterium]
MGVIDKVWAGISKVIKMDGKVDGLTSVVISQQDKIEDLTARVIRLEVRLDTYAEVAKSNRKSISKD